MFFCLEWRAQIKRENQHPSKPILALRQPAAPPSDVLSGTTIVVIDNKKRIALASQALRARLQGLWGQVSRKVQLALACDFYAFGWRPGCPRLGAVGSPAHDSADDHVRSAPNPQNSPGSVNRGEYLSV